MKTNIPAYQTCMSFVIEMFKKDVIDEDDYKEMEQFLADRFGIKDKSIYRLNKLINQDDYGINIVTRKETKNEQNNDHKTVVKIV